MDLEHQIRKIVQDELNKIEHMPRLVPLQKFCDDLGINRVTIWRAEKEGRLQLTRIGTRIFVDANQKFA